MTTEEHAIGNRLLQEALDATDHPAKAATLLMSAAATILQRSYGDAIALDIMTQGIDEAAAAVRATGHKGH